MTALRNATKGVIFRCIMSYISVNRMPVYIAFKPSQIELQEVKMIGLQPNSRQETSRTVDVMSLCCDNQHGQDVHRLGLNDIGIDQMEIIEELTFVTHFL